MLLYTFAVVSEYPTVSVFMAEEQAEQATVGKKEASRFLY
jgi:hypothetical protein